MKSHKTKVTIFERMQLLNLQENTDNLKTKEKKTKVSWVQAANIIIINISKNG